MRKVENIILHCSDSEFGCAREIRRWHMEKGWKDIGYHFVIMNGFPGKGYHVSSLDGSAECGRYLDEDLMVEPQEIGSHTLGYNDRSIGICLIGVKMFTAYQFAELICLLRNLCDTYKVPYDNILGHYETESGKAQGKTCPNFDVGRIREELKAGVKQ